MLDATDALPDSPGDARMLRLRRSRAGDTHVIELAGQFDIAAVAEVERELERVERSATGLVVLDLRRLTFIDASGLRVIVLAHRRRRDRLVIVKGPRQVQRVFEICDLVKRLPFVERPPRPSPVTPAHEADARIAALLTGTARRAAATPAAAINGADRCALAIAVRELTAPGRPARIR
jgi:anti-sigma B factor antagonist